MACLKRKAWGSAGAREHRVPEQGTCWHIVQVMQWRVYARPEPHSKFAPTGAGDPVVNALRTAIERRLHTHRENLDDLRAGGLDEFRWKGRQFHAVDVESRTIRVSAGV
jgi:hypothetical protein